MSSTARPEDLAQTSELRRATAGIAVVIPAYKPGPSLLPLVVSLTEIGFDNILVVDDGGGPTFAHIFQSLPSHVRVLRHATNLGKGAALKTGINAALCEVPEVHGIVTVDADGQHLAEDVAKVCAEFQNSKHSLVLGARSFEDKEIPLRSRFGNKLTRNVLRAVLGTTLRDTQTGLRVIPREFALPLLKVSSSGYDFELDMLVCAKQLGVPLHEVTITTVYEQGNKSSHFNPLIDSMKIYFVLLRFCSVSLLSALIDNCVFLLVFARGGPIGRAQLIARLVSIAFNYFAVRTAVFNSHKKHTVTGPRYLALAVISGVTSYILIRFISSTWDIPVVWAKIGVETALFFISFAVQRDFIFTRDIPDDADGTGAEARPTRSVLFRILLWVMFGVIIATFVNGFAKTGLTKEEITQHMWTPEGWSLYTNFAMIFGLIACVFAVFARRWFLPGIAASATILTVYAVGPMAVISLALFAFCSIVLARGLFGKDLPWALAFCGGVGIITALMQMLRDVPIHYAGAYLATAVAVVVLFRSAAWSFARQIVAAVRNPPHFPVRAFFALVLATFAVSAIWIAALEPEGSADGLAMHLKIPASMAIHHRFIFDFRRTIWALMPMGGDLAYSVLYIGGGEFGARLLNVFILAVVAVLVYGASKRFVSSSMAILLAAAFVSAPMAMAVTGSLMVDNFGTAFLVACISAVCLYHERGTARLFLLSSFLIGVGVAFKIGVVPMAAVMAGFLISAAIRHAKTGTALNWRVYSGAAALFLVAALWTYLAAWIQSGSPVYPWALGPLKPFNIPAAGPDGRFMQPLRLNTLYKLTFYTSLYCESLPKGFGFQYLLLVPLAVVAAFGSRSWGFRLALVSGLVGALVILKTAPNARYLYPVTAVLTVAFAGTLAFIRKQDRALYRLCSLCLLATVFLNLVCFATATWEHKEFYTPPLFSASSRKLNMRIHEPQREIITYLNRIDPVHAVFVAKNDLDAELVAPVFDRTWHDPVFGAQLTRATTPLDMYRLLRQLRVAHVIAPRVEANDKDVLQPVRDLLKTCGTEEFHNRDYASFRMSDDCESRLTAAVEK